MVFFSFDSTVKVKAKKPHSLSKDFTPVNPQLKTTTITDGRDKREKGEFHQIIFFTILFDVIIVGILLIVKVIKSQIQVSFTPWFCF